MDENKAKPSNQASISKEILRFFSKLYIRLDDDSWRIDGLEWSLPYRRVLVVWSTAFQKKEIWESFYFILFFLFYFFILFFIFFYEQGKCPKPSWFCLALYQECWDTTKEDLLQVFVKFLDNGIINKSIRG